MASSILNPLDNLPEGIHKIKCKYGHDNKKRVKRVEDCEYYLEYTNVKYDLMLCRCLCCNVNYLKKFNRNLGRRLANTYTFSNHDTNNLFVVTKSCLIRWLGKIR